MLKANIKWNHKPSVAYSAEQHSFLLLRIKLWITDLSKKPLQKKPSTAALSANTMNSLFLPTKRNFTARNVAFTPTLWPAFSPCWRLKRISHIALSTPESKLVNNGSSFVIETALFLCQKMENAVVTAVMVAMWVNKVRQASTNFSTTPSAKRNGKTKATDESESRKDRLTRIGASRYHSNTPQVEVDCSAQSLAENGCDVGDSVGSIERSALLHLILLQRPSVCRQHKCTHPM